MGAPRDFGEPLGVELKRTRRPRGGVRGRLGRVEGSGASLLGAGLGKWLSLPLGRGGRSRNSRAGLPRTLGGAKTVRSMNSRPPGPLINFAAALVRLVVCSPFIFLLTPVTSERGGLFCMFPLGNIPKKILSPPSRLRAEVRARRFSGDPR